ncbi:MAG TPA: methyltransferase domain-containing protein [Gemmatimonadaceae bacterium]
MSSADERTDGGPGAARAGADALRVSLERRFRTSVTEVSIRGEAIALLHPTNADDLISEEDYVRDERLPYWADIWPASQVLAGVVRAMDGGGRRLLELGCGLGLVATAAARAGFAVTASDYYDDALEFARLNAASAAGAAIATRMVDWRALPPDLGVFDVVAASDVLYERRYGPLVAEVLEATLAPDGIALIADPGRVGADAFLEECERRGMTARSEAPIPFRANDAMQQIRIYEVRRR